MSDRLFAKAQKEGWTDLFIHEGKVWGYQHPSDVMPQQYVEQKNIEQNLCSDSLADRVIMLPPYQPLTEYFGEWQLTHIPHTPAAIAQPEPMQHQPP